MLRTEVCQKVGEMGQRFTIMWRYAGDKGWDYIGDDNGRIVIITFIKLILKKNVEIKVHLNKRVVSE